MTQEPPVLNVGVVGLGLAAAMLLPAVEAMPNMRLIAGADTNPRALAAFKGKYLTRAYDSIEALCADPEVDVVWIATPNLYHCDHTILAAERGKHVIVEKPMAISLEDAQRMIDAAKRNGVHLLCGGSRSSSPAVREMRELILSGELGRLRAMTTWAATDWMLRPRRPDELDLAAGGGVAYRQAPHQVDTVRLLGGGLLRSVRAMTGQWMAQRDTAPGYFTAYLEFEDGTPATLIYNAYGYFMASELFEPEASGPLAPGAESRVLIRKEIRGGLRDELAAKEERVAAADIAPAASPDRRRSSFLSDLGLLVVSCEYGDMRQSPSGIYVYSDQGTREIALTEPGGRRSPELDELYDALHRDRPLLHSGEWGLATLETCLAIMQSATEHREIALQHQVPVAPGL